MSFQTAFKEGHAELAIKRAFFKAAETGDLSRLKPEWLTPEIFNRITFNHHGDSVLACAAQHQHLDKFTSIIDNQNVKRNRPFRTAQPRPRPWAIPTYPDSRPNG